ncbi:MAG: hypothetical protein J6R59_09800 [Paludibacteraceae bacterium]|nr:hypothetical protein [Paludibacteraceae bacterium]
MANTSIYAAFERFWQHTVALVGNYETKDDAQMKLDEAKAYADNTGGKIYIQNDEPTGVESGALWIDMDAGSYSRPSHTITYNLTNCTSSNTIESISDGGTYSATFTASSGYIDNYRAEMGGTVLRNVFTQTGSRTVTLNINKVIGDLIITVQSE